MVLLGCFRVQFLPIQRQRAKILPHPICVRHVADLCPLVTCCRSVGPLRPCLAAEMSELDRMKEIQLAAGTLGVRLFRNNVGVGWVGKSFRPVSTQTVTISKNDVVIYWARPLHAGLCKGSSDTIGYLPVTITQEMVGKTVAVFVACETKSKRGKSTEEQERFVKSVSDCGGIGIIAKTVQQVVSAIREFKGC